MDGWLAEIRRAGTNGRLLGEDDRVRQSAKPEPNRHTDSRTVALLGDGFVLAGERFFSPQA
jgi:hypothetical protein